jgi:hypothetical protein
LELQRPGFYAPGPTKKSGVKIIFHENPVEVRSFDGSAENREQQSLI